MLRATGLAVVLLQISAGAGAAPPDNAQAVAAASSCGQSVAAMADKLGISLDQDVAPPAAGGGSADSALGGSTNSERLAQTNGVVTPPDTGTHEVIKAPSTGDSMQTAPAMPPQAGSGSSTATSEQGGATRLQVHSLLSAAQAASRRGDEAQCQSSLDAAARLASKQP